nr:hypothetical protein [Tanacetum cinerariifolium]
MPIPDALLTDAIKEAPYYNEYLEHVTEYQRYLDAKRSKAEEEIVPESPKATKLVKETLDEPSPAKRSKCGLVGKRRKPKSPLKVVGEFADEGVLVKEPAYNEEEANLKRALDLSLKELEKRTQGPARLVVFREPDSRRFQPLPEVHRKGKEKFIKEQAAHDLLTLQTPKKKSLADQFIFQRHTPMSTESFGNAESPSMDAKLTMTNSVMKSDKEVPLVNPEKDASYKDLTEIDTGDQIEGQARPNPGKHDEVQAGPNPGSAAESQSQPSHVVYAGPNLKHMDLKVTDASTQDTPKQMDEEFTTTTYIIIQENLKLPTEDQFFVEKPHEEEHEKTNTESEVQSMVTVPIHQDNSSVPLITIPVIDLTVSQLVSITIQAPLPTSTATTTTVTITTILPLPLHQPQQSTADLTLLQHIENLNIPYQVSKAVDVIVTDVVDWAKQAPLQAHFSDLPAVDMKEIFQQRMFKDKSYEARQKKRKRCDLPRTPYGSPPLQPPPSLPPVGVFAALVQLSNNKDIRNDQLPKANTRKDWGKPLPEKESPETPKPAWTIMSSNMSDVKNNWATTLSSTHATPTKNSLLANIRDMVTFMNWYGRKVNKTMLTQADFKGQDYEVVKAFYLDAVHPQF